MLHNHDFTRPGGLHPALRARIEDRIERLIALLDAADGDPDLELAGDELDMTGSPDDPIFPGSRVYLLQPLGDRLAGDPDDAEDGGDAEPENADPCGGYGVDQRIALRTTGWGADRSSARAGGADDLVVMPAAPAPACVFLPIQRGRA